MSDFNKNRRQKFLSEKDYVEEEDSYRYGIQLAFESLSSNKPKAPGADSRHRWAIASKSLQLLLLNYTAGRPIEELKAQFPEVIGRFDVYMANAVSPRSKNPPENVADTFEITQLDAYVYVFWLLALCRLLGHSEFVPTVIGWVDKTFKFNRGRDGLFENVVQALTGTHVEAPRVVLHAVPYRSLASATIRAPEERPALVKEFVEGWYKGMKPAYWHGAHTDGLYFGYWCLEAALVTVLFDIDDSSYRDHLVYPKDLVDWYRDNPGVGTDDGPPKPKQMLRAMPGQSCPRSGDWFSHFLNKTVFVNADEPMPGPQFDAGGNQVIWYLEDKE
jgi:hypothetical protein